MSFLRSSAPFLVGLLLLGNCGAPPGGGCSSSRVTPSERFLGSQAPNFVLPDLAGEEVELAALANQKPTLLVFWATWCPTCLEEIPVLNEWSEKYPGLQILAVNVQEPAERVKMFVKKRGVRYAVVLDQEAEVAYEYGLVGVPAAVFLAKGGRVIYYGFSLPRNIDQLINV
jgi:thiol-disulfide isomerase/thioredoxin